MASVVGSRQVSDYRCLDCDKTFNQVDFTVGHVSERITHLYHAHCFDKNFKNGESRYCLKCGETQIKDNPFHIENEANIDSSGEARECFTCYEEIEEGDDVVGHVQEIKEGDRTVKKIVHLTHLGCFQGYYGCQPEKEHVCIFCSAPVLKNPSIEEDLLKEEVSTLSFEDRKKRWKESLGKRDREAIPNYSMKNSDSSEFLQFAVHGVALTWIREVLNLDLSQTFKHTILFNEHRVASFELAVENDYLPIVEAFIDHDNALRELGEKGEGRAFTEEQLEQAFQKTKEDSNVARYLLEKSHLKELRKEDASGSSSSSSAELIPLEKEEEEHYPLSGQEIARRGAIWRDVLSKGYGFKELEKVPLNAFGVSGFLQQAALAKRLSSVEAILNLDLLQTSEYTSLPNTGRLRPLLIALESGTYSVTRKFLDHDNELRELGRAEGRAFTDAQFRQIFDKALDLDYLTKQLLLTTSQASGATKLYFIQRIFEQPLAPSALDYQPLIRAILNEDLSVNRLGPALTNNDRMGLLQRAVQRGASEIVREFIDHDQNLQYRGQEARARRFTDVQLRTVFESALPHFAMFQNVLQRYPIDWPTRLHLMREALRLGNGLSFDALLTYDFTPAQFSEALQHLLNPLYIPFLRRFFMSPNVSLEARNRALPLLAARYDIFSTREYLAYLCGNHEISQEAIIEAIERLLTRSNTSEAVNFLYSKVISSEEKDNLVILALQHNHPFHDHAMKPSVENCVIL